MLALVLLLMPDWVPEAAAAGATALHLPPPMLLAVLLLLVSQLDQPRSLPLLLVPVMLPPLPTLVMVLPCGVTPLEATV